MGRVLIYNAWHDDNKGDCAILHATLAMVARRWPGSTIAVHSLIGRRDPAFRSAFRHAPSAPAPFTSHGSPAAMLRTDRHSPLHALLWTLASARFFSARFPRRLDPDGASSDKPDAVVLVGGSNVFDSGRRRPMGEARLLRVLAPARRALALGIPTYLIGHTLGPFATGYSRRLVRRLADDGAHFLVREGYSLELGRELGIPPERLAAIPDVAFLTRPLDDEAVAEVRQAAGLTEGTSYAVIAPRTHPYDDEDGSRSRRLAQELAKFATGLLDQGLVERVLVVPQCLGPTTVEDDRYVARELRDLTSPGRVVVVAQDLAPSQLAAIYGAARLVVAVRLHAVILALVGGAPVFAIEYFTNKTKGILTDSGLGDSWCRYDDVNAGDLLARWSQLTSPDRRDHVRALVENFRDTLHAWSELT